jgi:lipid-A-disaccharide synthase
MTKSFRIFISTGEVSGDLQGSLLMRALEATALQRGWSLAIDALGGPRMAAAGAQLLANTASLGAIGFFESLPYVRRALSIQQQVRRYLQSTPPDLTVLIDYPGVNVPLSRDLKRLNSGPAIYYIAPQEWAWSIGKGTTRQIVDNTDLILSIFPQEAEYYQSHGATVTWVGHPFIDALAEIPSRNAARQSLGIPPSQKAIALIPASRQQELRYIWPVLATAAQQIQTHCPEAHFWIPVALETFRTTFQDTIERLGLNATLTDQSQLTLAAADLALGKSGTANLEAALLNVPQVAIYCIHPVNGWLYRNLLRFKVPYISPVNLVQQACIVPELLQEQATPEAISHLALELLEPSPQRLQILNQYRQLRNSLGTPGVFQRAAEAILNRLSERAYHD